MSEWRNVDKASGPRSGRGSVLGPDTTRRAKWWVLNLDCGHTAERSVRYKPLEGWPPQRGGTQHRSMDDVLPAPKRVRCHACPGALQATGCPACGSDDYDTEPGDDGLPDYEHGLKKCQDCGEEWV